MKKDKMIIGYVVGVVAVITAQKVSEHIIKNKTNEGVKAVLYLAVHAGIGLAAGLVMRALDTNNNEIEGEVE